MKPLTTTAAAVGLTLACAAPALAQSKLYVASEGAELKADKTADSNTIAQLKLGRAVSVLGQEGSWYKISTGSVSGWMYRGKLASSPPTPSQQGGDSLFGGIGSSGIAVAEADSSRSMRGLSEESEAKAAGRPARPLSEYKSALKQVLSEKVSRKELQSFLKAGKIGEFANS